MNSIGFIGTGNMGGAIARAVSAAGYTENIVLYDKDQSKAKLLAEELDCRAGTLSEVACCDCIFLGVKPQYLKGALSELCSEIRDHTPLCVSMAAGVSLATLREWGCVYPTVRIMPNTPVGVGEGMVLYTANEDVTERMLTFFLDIMARAGLLSEIDEGRIDAASAISGCGPAFVCLFLEALADGGVAAGLSRDAALAYARQTLLGTARLMEVTGKHPGVLKDEVCSPAGSTIAGVRALEEGGFRASAINAVLSAYHRTKELGKQ